MEKLSTSKVVELVKKKEFPAVAGQEYLLGFRGLLTIECFLWTFLSVFAPNTVKDANIPQGSDGPFWQIMFRKTLSVLFWNGTLIFSFLVILSARSLPIPFFKKPTRSAVASAVFRRGIRLFLPVTVTMAIVTTAFAVMGVDYIGQFISITNNGNIQVPYFLPNAFVFFNSCYQLFWVTSAFFTQSGNFAFPSQTLWMINLVYQQSYTVFIIMCIVPYTRAAWRVKMAVPFLLTAWWVQSWAWYTVTGLLFADMVMNMDFKARSQRGIPIPFTNGFRLPSWLPATVLMVGGLLMQYLWTDWRTDLLNAEIDIHTGLYYGGELNQDVDPRQPQARDDNYLFILGFFIVFETFDFLQNFFKNPVLVYIGKRSLSKFFFF
jgi:hypothetical protein